MMHKEIDGETYEWQDIDGKGKCLVPIEKKEQVTAEDVCSGRRYYGGRDRAITQFIHLYGARPKGRFYGDQFFTVVHQSRSLRLYGYSDCSFATAQEMADKVNACVLGVSSIAFDGWVDEK